MARKKRGTFLAAGHDESRTGEEISGERCGRLFGYIRKSRESISEESAVNGKKFDAER